MTPCEKLGYKVGDKFEVVTGSVSGFKVESIVELIKDDGTDCPKFSGNHADGDGWGFITLRKIRPVTAKSKPVTISKSKRQLAQLLIEAGVTQFPEGANWAAQDKSGTSIYCYKNKPRRPLSWESWHHDGDVVGGGKFEVATLIPNWHQTVLSRDEFDQIVAETVVEGEPDSDVWIEWKGGACPVGGDDRIDVKFSDGDTLFDVDSDWDWGYDVDMCNIIAYRPHKPEQSEPQYCESVTRSIPEPTTVPTLDQLLQGWRNADDYAQRKQTEADEAAAMRDERWQMVQARAGEMGVTVGRCEPDLELVVTDWNEWRVGDEVECIKTPRGAECMPGMRGFVTRVQNEGVYARFPEALRGGNDEWYSKSGYSYRFIRRP